MIIKSKGRKSKTGTRQLLEYITRGNAQFRDGEGKTLLIKNNLRGASIEDWCREFAVNEECRIHKKKNTNAIYHEIISFHAGDTKQITIATLGAIAREYIRLRNPYALSVVTAHGDKDHVHLHCALSGVEYKTGKSLRVDRKVFNDMVVQMERYQEKNFPELVFSVVDFDKKKE
jgi:Relaxase/Mobilisation nuclease domain